MFKAEMRLLNLNENEGLQDAAAYSIIILYIISDEKVKTCVFAKAYASARA